ncbi:MAG TPA: hypothetical protein EYP78_02545 [Candidatus Omnitrophica bacterium]|nr:hypothetical protein [Candidatus Omnitrophota bacterium]
MAQPIIYIGIGSIGKDLGQDFPSTLIVREEGGGEAEFIVSGDSLAKITEDFLSKEETFITKLSHYHEAFKQQKVDDIRYLLLCPLWEKVGVSIPIELTRLIRRFHQEVTHMTYEIEALLILPSLSTSKEQKGYCFEFLSKLDSEITESEGFDFLWLLDSNRLPPSALRETIRLYLSTDIYGSFHAQARGNILREKFEEGITAYSTLGIFKLVFPARRWQLFLSLKLVRDILSLTPLSPLEPLPETARMATSGCAHFFEKTELPRIVDNIRSHTELSGAEQALQGLLQEAEEIEKIIDRFFAKLELLTNQEEGKLWEDGGLKQYSEGFRERLKKEAERIMDTESHGPFSSLGFITLLLNREGPYTNLLRELEEKGEQVPMPTNLVGYLLGWKGKEDSATLKIIFEEITTELREIYATHFIPFPEPKTWDGLWNELERIISLPDFNILLGKDSGRILELKEITKLPKTAYERPYTCPLTPDNIRTTLDVIEKYGRKRLENLLAEVKSVEEKLAEIEAEIKGLGWWRYLPHKWGLFLDRRAIRKSRAIVRERLKDEAELIIEKRKRLLPCYIFILIYKRLDAILSPLEEEIRGFTEALIAESEALETEMNQITFDTDTLNFQIAEKNEKDISKLHYTQFRSQDIPQIFEKEFFEFLKVPSELSRFYTEGERERFFSGLRLFALAKFQWLLGWNAEKVMLHLGKTENLLDTLQSYSRPFIAIKNYPEEQVRDCLYIGLEDETQTKLIQSPYIQCLRGSFQFYSAGNPWEITGLRIVHGFPLFVVEGWEHWKRCYEEVEEARGSGGSKGTEG